MSKYALIGGTGVEHLALAGKQRIELDTPYGSIPVEIGNLGGEEIVFMSRHGHSHAIPPHLVNYRGNIWALHKLGVKKILATAAVGSLASKFRLGDLILVDQFLDFTKSRVQTFYEGGTEGVLHVDMTEPYCASLRQAVMAAAETLGIEVKNGATYVCTEGPRFETPAEIRMYQMLGGEVVGMTSVPEVVLARELGMCYATVGMVTNEAAGIASHPLTHAEVMDSMKVMGQTVAHVLGKTFNMLDPEQTCLCRLANAELGKF